MRYILDSEDYIEAVTFGGFITCNNNSCTEYTGSVPSGYETLEEWSNNANIRAYKIENGNLVYDSNKDAELQELWQSQEANNIGGVEIGAGLSLENGVLSATGGGTAVSDVYSTSEVKTNKIWINGKPIYRKVFNFGALPSNTAEKTIDTGLLNSEVNIIDARGFSINNTNTATVIIPRSHPTTVSSAVCLNLWTNASTNKYTIGIVCGSDRSIYTTTYIILEYIKIKD